ncbi:MAG: ATP-binding cassette domain-containing protein [Deltaproteobacteria bacterium]|nr:ATP-binding cassette domain-containing protein [Deltaproteobacteria bacterium]
MSKDATDKTADQPSPPKPLGWLFGNVRHARGWILLSVSTGFVSGLLLILQASLLSRIIHGAFIDGLSRTVMNPLFLMLCGLIALRAGLAWAREVSGFYAGAGVRQEVRIALMRHIGVLGPVQADRPHSGALSTTIVEQVEALQAFYAHYLPQLALAVSIPAAIAAFVFPISWAAGGLLLLTAPLIPLFMILIGMGAETISQKNFQALSRMSAHFLDILQGLPTLKLLGRSRAEETSIAKVSDEYRLQTMKVLRVAFLSTAVLELFSSLSIALVAVYLGTTYLGYAHFGLYGQILSLKQGLFILLLAPDFYLPLRELGIHYHARAEAMGAAQEILDILSRRPAATFTGVRQMETSTTPLTVDCHKIQFAYDNRKGLVLTDVSIGLAPGEHVALVGESGAGKTTLLHLLLGFIHAWVGQHPMLFHDTIAGNIGMALPGAKRTDIEQAARSARVLDFARHLPRGLDTKVGEQGWGLSRGQAQRVALARVFLKDAPILLLDEPTAGLDVDTAKSVMQTLSSFSKDRTVLLLTHRLDQLQTAHRIIVLAGGRLVDQGSYAELTNRQGLIREAMNGKQ